MVKLRGISVSMISQHGICKLPEYELPILAHPVHTDGPTLRSLMNPVASCYVLSHPGSQIWFDYSIEKPHPPNAQYFFKMLRNGEVVTSWDCTARHDYRGRTSYALKYLGTHPQTGQPVIKRQAFCFNHEPSGPVGPFGNCIEIRVYRIEHRARLPLGASSVRTDEPPARESIYQHGFRLVNGGVLAASDPKRRYKYQLLDPVDKPYTTIRFYYRSKEFLIKSGIIVSPPNHSRQSSTASTSSGKLSDLSDLASQSASKASSSRSPTRPQASTAISSSRHGTPPTDSVANWLHHHRLQKYTAILKSMSFDALVTLSDNDLASLGVVAKGARAKLLRELAAYNQQHLKQVKVAEEDPACWNKDSSPTPRTESAVSSSPSSAGSPHSSEGEYVGYCLGNPGTGASLRIITKDNAEEGALPTPPKTTLSAPPQKMLFSVEDPALPAASRTTISAPAEKTTFSTEEIEPTPPTKSSKKSRKSLRVQINGAEFDLGKNHKRPLSPFTSGGMLRRLLSPSPPSAPANVTTFGPTIDDEVGGMLAEMESDGSKARINMQRTTRAERNGGALHRILKTRICRG